jgi:hypothetical protein
VERFLEMEPVLLLDPKKAVSANAAPPATSPPAQKTAHSGVSLEEAARLVFGGVPEGFATGSVIDLDSEGEEETKAKKIPDDETPFERATKRPSRRRSSSDFLVVPPGRTFADFGIRTPKEIWDAERAAAEAAPKPRPEQHILEAAKADRQLREDRARKKQQGPRPLT